MLVEKTHIHLLLPKRIHLVFGTVEILVLRVLSFQSCCNVLQLQLFLEFLETDLQLKTLLILIDKAAANNGFCASVA